MPAAVRQNQGATRVIAADRDKIVDDQRVAGAEAGDRRRKPGSAALRYPSDGAGVEGQCAEIQELATKPADKSTAGAKLQRIRTAAAINRPGEH